MDVLGKGVRIPVSQPNAASGAANRATSRSSKFVVCRPPVPGVTTTALATHSVWAAPEAPGWVATKAANFGELQLFIATPLSAALGRFVRRRFAGRPMIAVVLGTHSMAARRSYPCAYNSSSGNRLTAVAAGVRKLDDPGTYVRCMDWNGMEGVS